ncbi:MAG: nucleoside hydrolase [Acidobacteria bacterium]|nr:nucleoside hydrolase [Acidobacteriota bacterium]
MSHDGAVDDLIALALAATAPDVDFLGVSLVNGDCLIEPTLDAQARLFALLDRCDIEWSLSRARAFNAFPWEYRGDCARFLGLPALAGIKPMPSSRPFPDGERHFEQVLERESDGAVTVLATGPLTPLQLVLERRPELESKIERIVWMGGAIDAAGNLDPATLPSAAVNPFAEWNAYWDPFAVDWIFHQTAIPIMLVPLDVCDAAPVDPGFVARLLASEKPLARLAGQAYAMVADQPFYRLWDVVAACAALEPALFEPAEAMQLVIETWGPEQGRIRRDPPGRPVDVLLRLNAPAFFDFVVERLSR